MSLVEALRTRINMQRDQSQLIFHCKIPLQHHVAKKNNRPIFKVRATGRSFLGKSPELQKYELLLVAEFQRQARLQNIVKPHDGPIWAMFHFYFPNFFTKKGQMNMKLGDLSNLYQLPEDCLQKAGIIENDSLIMSHDLSRKLPGQECLLEVFLFTYHELNERPTR